MENGEAVPQKKNLHPPNKTRPSGHLQLVTGPAWILIFNPERDTFGRQAYHREFSADGRGRGFLRAVRGRLPACAPLLPTPRNGCWRGGRTGAGRDGHRLPTRRRGARERILQRVAVQSGDIIILRFVEELSYEELAVALAIPVGTVKWRLFNAKKKLAPIIKASLPAAARRFN
jgi:hypothetical protein